MDPARLEAAWPMAWLHHDALVNAGARHPWHALMTALLEGAGVVDPTPHVAWLWSEQPHANLWRRPVPGVVQIARELASVGYRVAVLSNSEGRIAELLEEVGIADAFGTIVDSGKVGVAKPDRAIFEYAIAASGGRVEQAIHIGDSWAADVVGARGAGWQAIWYGPHVEPVTDEGVASARDPAELRVALARWL